MRHRISSLIALLGLVEGNVLLSELSPTHIRKLLEATGKVSEEELSLATPAPTQVYGKFDPSLPEANFGGVITAIRDELAALNSEEVSKRVLDIIYSLSKVSIKGYGEEDDAVHAQASTKGDDRDDESRRRLNSLDPFSNAGNMLSGQQSMTFPGWGPAQASYQPAAWGYNPYMASPAALYGTPTGANTYGGGFDPWAAVRPMAYGAPSTAYYAPPMVPGMNMMPMRSLVTSPQASTALLQMMMMNNPLYSEFAKFPGPMTPPITATEVPAALVDTQAESASNPSPPDIQSLLSSMTADMGNSLGERVGSTLGTSLAADLNLINGVANSAASNFRNLINTTQYKSAYGVYPAAAGAGVPPTFSGQQRRRLDTASDLSSLINLLSAASTLATTTTTTAAPVAVGSSNNGEALQALLAQLGGGSAVANAKNNSASATSLLTEGISSSSIGIPTLAPLEAVTVNSVADTWNNAILSLTNTSQSLSLPTLDNFNASLPEISTIGNGAGLPDISNMVGQNLGASLGSTMGNMATGTTSLIGSYISGAKEAFLGAFAPNLASLIGGSSVRARRLSAVAHKRRLDSNSPTCALTNTLYRSSDSITFNNVDSLTVCQMICQTYSDAGLFFANCASRLSSSDRQCTGVSFSEITGRCTMFYSIEDQFNIEGFSSAPLHCDNSTFVQTQARVNSMKANTDCSAQLDWTYIRTVADKAAPTAPEVLLVTAFPEFPAFENKEVATSNIWHYNPDTPVASADGEFKDNIIYQIGYGVSNTDGYWGQSVNITDWRYCAWLCTQQSLCAYWTYYFRPDTYASSRGGCSLATNTVPLASAVSSVQTISGPRMAQMPVELFGSYGNTGRRLYVADPDLKLWVPAASPPKRRLESPYVSTIIDPKVMSKYGLRQLEGEADTTEAIAATASKITACEDAGFAYRSQYSVIAKAERLGDTAASFVARTPEACSTACKNAPGCVAWQYLPEYTISTDTRLQESQLTTCALLSSVGGKVPSVPQMVSGINVEGTCTQGVLPPMGATISSVPVSTPTSSQQHLESSESTEAPSMIGSGVSNVTSCFDENGAENHFADGVSIRGRLLSGGNNVRRDIETPEKCRQECEGAENCTVFSWGQWQGCYLMETVEAFVADTRGLMFAGYRDCRDNARNELSRRRLEEVAGESTATEEEDRSVVTCERASRGVIYTEGTILSQVDNEYVDADACWTGCRSRPDCFYMSYITANETNVCVFFSDVAGTAEVATSVATSAESNCDVLGDIDFEVGWWNSVAKASKSKKVGAAVGGTIGGVFVLAGLIIGGRTLTKRKVKENRGTTASHTTFLADLTPSVDGEESGVSQELVKQDGSSGRANNRKRNMFGMASPGALERGSPTLHVDDFEKVEPKSTGKRLRRYF